MAETVELSQGRLHYTDTGGSGPVVVLVHGLLVNGSLWRDVVPALATTGARVIVPELPLGSHPEAMRPDADLTPPGIARLISDFITALDLREVTLVGQDWGGLIGLRLVAEHPGRFRAHVAANTGLPTGDRDMPPVWWQFRRAVETAEVLDIGRLVRSGCRTALPAAVAAAYDAPFPDETYKAGPRAMPTIVPTRPDDPAAPANRAAWAVLRELDLPLLAAFSDGDPITAPMLPLLLDLPGAAGRDHPTITGAGHFLQEDAGPELAAEIVRFLG